MEFKTAGNFQNPPKNFTRLGYDNYLFLIVLFFDANAIDNLITFLFL